MRRFVSIWLPSWPTDRWRRLNDGGPARPLVLAMRGAGGLRVAAVDPLAAAEGLVPGITLADARALVPHLATANADPAADAEALGRLAEWCQRFTPLAAVDGGDGLLLDTTGCDHLFGGETCLLAEMTGRLSGGRIAARTAVADTPAAAWAWARFRPEGGGITPVPPRESLRALPVAALRLPDALTADLARVGLCCIGSLLDLPRAPLVTRYGEMVGRRLDRMFGDAPEAIAMRRSPQAWESRLALAEPISRREDIETAAVTLLDRLCRDLEEGGRGARRLDLLLFRVDASMQRLEIGTSRPSREPKHLLRLFRERFDGVDPRFGIELLLLRAPATDLLPPLQAGLERNAAEESAFAHLLDRLQTRLGAEAVLRPMPQDTHIPERVMALRPADDAPCAAPALQPGGAPRPVLLLERPEPVEMAALIGGGPVAAFHWRGRRYAVGRWEGPERIEREWWRDARGIARDYYRAEDFEGHRFWLFRAAGDGEADWYLHGMFA